MKSGFTPQSGGPTPAIGQRPISLVPFKDRVPDSEGISKGCYEAGKPKNGRIVLIKPPLYTCSTYSPIRSAQPLGIWQLGSYLKARGHDVKIIDAVIEGWNEKVSLDDGSTFDFPSHMREKTAYLYSHSPSELLSRYPVVDREGNIRRTLIRTGLGDDEIIERVRDFDPGWIGISIIATCEHRGAIALAKRLKLEFPDAMIVAGGQHPTDMAGMVLADSKGSIDFVVKGNGELTFEALLKGERPSRGLAYVWNGGMIEQEDSLLTPIDLLPPLEPALIAHVNYPIPPTHSFGTSGRKYADYMLSFGCHKRCDFCRQGTVLDGYRHLSLEQVERQLRLFRENGIEELILQDDSLLGGPRNDGMEFFSKAISLLKSHGFHWHDNGGVEFERLNTAAVDAILAANDMRGEGRCTALYVPFNPRHLNQRRVVEHHMQNMQGNLGLLRKLTAGGIYVFTSGIWGHVNQDINDMESDISGYEELLSEGIVDQVVIFGLSYLPRTRDWEYRHLIADQQDWEGYSIFVPHAGTTNASFLDVNHMVIEAYRRLNPLQPHTEPWASGFPSHIPQGWR